MSANSEDKAGSLDKLSDEQLMQAYQTGSSEAFETLYRRHSGRVYGYLRSKLRERALVDDVFQAIFLKLHRARGRYDASFPFVPWLYTVCRSVLLDNLRQTSRRIEDASEPTVLEDAICLSSSFEAPDSTTTAREVDFSTLTEEQRKAIELRYQQDLSFEAIADALQTSPANARQIISRAVRKLRSRFSKEGSHE